MSYLGLTNKIRNNELTEEEVIECLEVKNVVVLQHTILKIISKGIKNEYIFDKLIENSKMMGAEHKILGLCKLGYLAIYALKKLGYFEEYEKLSNQLSKFEKEPIEMLENSL